MKKSTLLMPVVMAALVAATMGENAKAARSGLQADLTNFMQAKIGLADAIAAAQRATHGQAMSGWLIDRDGKVVFDIAVMKDGAIHAVSVDPDNGRVLKVSADVVVDHHCSAKAH